MLQKTIGYVQKTIKSEGFLKYLKNTSWLVGEKIGIMAASFVIGAIVTRYLGTANRGLIDYALSTVAFVSCFIGLGINADIINRYMVTEPERKNHILGTSFALWFGTAIIFSILFIIGYYFVTTDLNETALIGIILLGQMFHAFNVIGAYFESRVEAKHAVVGRIAQFIVSSIVKIVLVIINAPLIWFAFAFLLNDMALGLSMSYMYFKEGNNILKWRLDLQLLKKMILESWPLLFSALMVVIYMKIDQIMIKNMLGASENGIYSVAVRLSEIWYFIPGAIGTSLFPSLVKARKENYELYMLRMQRFYTLMVVLAVGIGIGMSLFGEWLLVFAYGEEFRASASVLQLHIWSSIFVFIGVVSYYWLIAENKQKQIFNFTVVGALFNVGLNIYLIPRYGIQGAAFATLVAQATASYLAYAMLKNTRKVFVLKTRSLLMIDLFQIIKSGKILP